jgi:CubicO group peptidase (beta-lactamase class C family)
MKPRWQRRVCLLLSVWVTACAAQTPLERELQAIVDDPVTGMASLSVLAVRQGRVAYQGQFGHRSIDPATPGLSKPATAATLYRIASVSKFVTTLGVMRLVEEGVLSLDRDVGDYLGDRLRNPAFPGQAVTLRMLLSHTSSLRDDAGYFWAAGTSLAAGMQARPGAWDQQRPPGAWFSYSNLNWGVIGTVMEAATGRRFDQLMHALVLAPLELEGGFNVSALSPASVDNIATLYRKRAPDGPWFAQVDDYSSARPLPPPGLDQYRIGSNGTVFSPTGGLRMSAADLGKIMLMLLAQGQASGRQFLQPATVAAMFSTQWRYDSAAPNGDTDHGLFTRWGLGVQHFGSDGSMLVADGSFPAAGHLGEAWGLYSVFAVDIDRRNGMVVLIGGTASDPSTTPGSYSSLTVQEERVLTAIHQRVLRPPATRN